MNRGMRKGVIGLATVIAAVGIAAGSQAQQPTSMPASSAGLKITKALAVIHPTAGNTVQGAVTFTQVDGGVHVVAYLTGLSAGTHGFHIHEYGDCSAPDGASAGGHFNPAKKQHGGPDDMDRHAGDLGNITADDAGNAALDRVDAHLSLNGPDTIVGRGVIVHEKADDMKTQPTGAAGARLGCGVIGVAKE